MGTAYILRPRNRVPRGLVIFDEVTQSKSSGRVAIILAIGRGVEPLWVTAGMLTYTSVEGVSHDS